MLTQRVMLASLVAVAVASTPVAWAQMKPVAEYVSAPYGTLPNTNIKMKFKLFLNAPANQYAPTGWEIGDNELVLGLAYGNDRICTCPQEPSDPNVGEVDAGPMAGFLLTCDPYTEELILRTSNVRSPINNQWQTKFPGAWTPSTTWEPGSTHKTYYQHVHQPAQTMPDHFKLFDGTRISGAVPWSLHETLTDHFLFEPIVTASVLQVAQRLCKPAGRACVPEQDDGFVPLVTVSGDPQQILQSPYLTGTAPGDAEVSCSCLNAYLDDNGCTSCPDIPASQQEYCNECSEDNLAYIRDYNRQLYAYYCPDDELTPGDGALAARGTGDDRGNGDGASSGTVVVTCVPPGLLPVPACDDQCNPEDLPSHQGSYEYSVWDWSLWGLNGEDLAYLAALAEQNATNAAAANAAFQSALAAYQATPAYQAYLATYESTYAAQYASALGQGLTPEMAAYAAWQLATLAAGPAPAGAPNPADYPAHQIDLEHCALEVLSESKAPSCVTQQTEAIAYLLYRPDALDICDGEGLGIDPQPTNAMCSAIAAAWHCVHPLDGGPSGFDPFGDTYDDGWWFDFWTDSINQTFFSTTWDETSDDAAGGDGGGALGNGNLPGYGCPVQLQGSQQYMLISGPMCARTCTVGSNPPVCAGPYTTFTVEQPGVCQQAFTCPG